VADLCHSVVPYLLLVVSIEVRTDVELIFLLHLLSAAHRRASAAGDVSVEAMHSEEEDVWRRTKRVVPRPVGLLPAFAAHDVLDYGLVVSPKRRGLEHVR
jgi:hypothetical protein